jgi:hypothetical protein
MSMSIRIVQFVAVMLTVLAVIPGGAHLLELPNKMALDRDAYMIVQRIYRGWAMAGVVLVAALLATLWLAIASRSQALPMTLASSAFFLVLATLITFFIWVYPVNQATGQWTAAPTDFERLRAQWEYTHAVNAVLTLLAVAATVAASLSWKSN